MPTFVLSCSQGASSCATLVHDALAGSVDVRVALRGVDVFERLLAGECDGVVLHLEEARQEAAGRGLSCQVIAREERRDVLMCSDPSSEAAPRTLGGLAEGSRIGVIGTRRLAYLRAFRPDVEALLLSDDLTTAMDRLDAGDVAMLIAGGADVVAHAAGKRVSMWLEPTSWVPTPGGGGVGLVLPPGRGPILVSPDIKAAVIAEESVLEGLSGTAVGEIGALAIPYGSHLRLWGLVVSPDGARAVRADLTGTVADAADLGARVAEALLENGAGLTTGERLQ